MRKTKRYIAILISVMMLFAFAPASGFAAEDATGGESSTVNTEASSSETPAAGAEQGTGNTEQEMTEEGNETPPDLTVSGNETEEEPTSSSQEETTTTAATTTAPTPTPTTIPVVKVSGVTAGKTYVKVKWVKPAAASLKRIQIQCCSNRSFKNHIKTATTAATSTSKAIKKLTTGTGYYVRVRAYMKIDGKTRYSKWSAVKYVKTKGTNYSKKKLSSVYVKVAKGGAKTIKLKKGKGKWSLGGSGVIKFGKRTGKSAKVIPLKAGTETVYCKVGGKTYICTVRVLNNSVGNPKTQFGYALVVGQKEYWKYDLPKGMKYQSTSYDKKKGKVTISATSKSVKITVKALKPGRFKVKNTMVYKGKKETWTINFAFINGFRGKAKAKKTKANYAKWRSKTINTLVSADMSSWEIADAIGKLISSGRYSSKGGATGIQLWYGGNGTCVSGAKMMRDFMNDLGIKSRVHSAGKDKGPKDIFGNYMRYNKGHKNIYVTMGGKTYEMNPQPGVPWPLGTVAR